MRDYYYTDKEELDALRVENSKLKEEIVDLKKKLAKKSKEVKTNEYKEN